MLRGSELKPRKTRKMGDFILTNLGLGLHGPGDQIGFPHCAIQTAGLEHRKEAESKGMLNFQRAAVGELSASQVT